MYSEFSRKVFDLLRTFSPDVRAFSIDEGLVNLTGTERLMGHPIRTANEIIDRIKEDLGLPSSGGLASHPTLAKIAATAVKPRGLLYVPPGSEERFLGPLDVSAIPGVGPKTHRELVDRGIATVAPTPRSAPAGAALPEPGPPGGERTRARTFGRERDHAGATPQGSGGHGAGAGRARGRRGRQTAPPGGPRPARHRQDPLFRFQGPSPGRGP